MDTRDLEITDYDQIIKDTIDGMGDKQKRLCRYRWIYRDTISAIASKEKLTVDGVRWRLDAIREYIARHAGL